MMKGKSGKFINDFMNSKKAIMISFGMGFIYSLVLIKFLSAFAEPLAWFCVFLIQVALLGATAACFMEYSHLKKSHDAEDKKEASGTLGLTILFGILACAFACCVVCGRDSLKKAIDVIDAAADFIDDNKRVILVPIFYLFFSLIIMAIWMGAFACVASLNDIKVGADQSVVPQNKDITWTRKTTYMGLFMLFGILWLLAYLDYTSRFIVMASAATYYFNSGAGSTETDSDGQPVDGEAELMYAIKIAHLNHAGSIAFGSFIIAVVQMIELIFMYFAKQAKQAGGDNQAVKIIIACGECILKCIEKIVDYINSAAYAYMAVTGNNFCSSAWNGFLLNVKHCMEFAFANTLAKVFILLGKVALTVGNCFSFLFILKHVTKSQVNSVAGPVVIVGIISFFIASLFLGIFETAVMSLMTCLSIDTEVNKEAKYGPQTFRDKADAINKGQDTQRDRKSVV